MSYKKLLSFLFVLIMIISTCVISAGAAQAQEYTDKNGVTFYYALYDDNGKTKAIIGDCRYNKDKAFTLSIPSKLGGYPVAAIAEEAMFGHKLIKAVKFPDSLEYIGDYAFNNANIPKVTIPKNVSYIGKDVFSYVKSYTVAKENKYYKSVDGVLYSKDGKYLISYPQSNSAKSFAVPKGVKYIYDEAFECANSLTKVTFPESLEYIGSYAFASAGLKSLHIGKNIVYIGEFAFYHADKLKKVTIDEDAYPYFGTNAFDSTGLKRDSMGAIYFGHILYNVDLENPDVKVVKIKEGTTVLSSNTVGFYGVSSVRFPSTLQYFSVEDLYNKNIPEISVDEDNPYYTSIDGALYTKDKKTLLLFPNKEVDTYTLADTTEAIYPGAFCGYGRIKKLIFPESYKYIYKDTFKGLSITHLTFLGDVQYLEKDALVNGCYFLEEIDLPENAVMLGIEDFRNLHMYLSLKDGFFFIDNILLGYKGSFNRNVMSIPENTTSIGRKAFSNHYLFEELHLPENLKAVGEFAFSNCKNVKEVYIPATVDEIGAGAFGYNISFDKETGNPSSYTKIDGFVIKGYTNSLAESYADANGFEFVPVGYMEPESTLLGDLDCDGRLTVRDATALQKYVAGMVGLNTQDKINADFNFDGKINVRDATAIQKRLARLD